MHAEVLVVGGGLGGVAAALSACRAGRRVILTEETRWLGGQLTSQAVPPDEHTWIESFGCTASYRSLRNGLREYYRRAYPLSAEARRDPFLNPGQGLVSRLCVEPRAGVAVIEELLAPYRSAGLLRVLLETRPVAAEVAGDRVLAVEFARPEGQRATVEADIVLDATELGDLLDLAQVEHVTGFESREEHGEPSAPEEAQPLNQQAFSWCFVLEHVDGDHTIDRPADYSGWAAKQPEYWGAPMISLTGPDPRGGEAFTRTFTPHLDEDPEGPVADQRAAAGDRELWTFRRIAARSSFEPGFLPSDLVLVNWPMIDYVDGVLVGDPDSDPEVHLAASRRQSLAMLYWLQTEAPRPDGGTGWSGLRLRGDVTGTDDGFAMAPYIRESRRIRARTTVVEQDLSIASRGHGHPARVEHSVGIGMYRIDLHPSSGGDNYLDIASAPFEIPLGALVPERMRNLLPAAKNLGTTHITNGAYRLHPVEWNIGESAGALAALCLDRGAEPAAVLESPELRDELDRRLDALGVERHWPEVAGY